ncbi:hypothetical protein L596_021222 [Steinernema carpocapsae]|uniref:DNA2/NAM7 helicase helicase domain-containing protein n=2 Tax=Steinernema carpocapsae TaxID=34508 RepID=A0A4U5MVT6_STECR|nr:hypothetical protein L596_021222 [Steinernema carpocapsae]
MKVVVNDCAVLPNIRFAEIHQMLNALNLAFTTPNRYKHLEFDWNGQNKVLSNKSTPNKIVNVFKTVYITFLKDVLNPSDLLVSLHPDMLEHDLSLNISFKFSHTRDIADFVLSSWSTIAREKVTRNKLAVCVAAPRILNSDRSDHPVKQMRVFNHIEGNLVSDHHDAYGSLYAWLQIRHVTNLFEMTQMQAEAVIRSFQYRFNSVMGPPGTGKTFVMAVTLIIQLMLQHYRRSDPTRQLAKTIVVAPSNVAVDQQLQKFHWALDKLRTALHLLPSEVFRKPAREVVENYLFDQSKCMIRETKYSAKTDCPRHVVPKVHRAYPMCSENLDHNLRHMYKLNRSRRQVCLKVYKRI